LDSGLTSSSQGRVYSIRRTDLEPSRKGWLQKLGRSDQYVGAYKALSWWPSPSRRLRNIIDQLRAEPFATDLSCFVGCYLPGSVVKPLHRDGVVRASLWLPGAVGWAAIRPWNVSFGTIITICSKVDLVVYRRTVQTNSRCALTKPYSVLPHGLIAPAGHGGRIIIETSVSQAIRKRTAL
jgi:hypothetical protein